MRRAERFDDDEGAISGTPQDLHEVTLTLKHRPVPHLLLRLEGRYDRSTADVFATSEKNTDGSPVRTREQFLLVLGGVAPQPPNQFTSVV